MAWRRIVASLSPSRLHHGAAVPLLLALFAGCGAYSLVRESATFDETAHLPAGFTYLDRGDFRHNPEHPPLAKLWAALPLWAFGLAHADYASPNWMGTRSDPADPQRSRADQWKFGFEFLNGPIASPVRNDPGRLLAPARTMMLVPGLLLGLLVYTWARELWGREAGLLALVLAVLSPTLLAHARLVTTDLPAGLGFTATLWCFWRYCRRPGWSWGWATGLALAAAFLTKYSALMLIPILVLLGLLWWWQGIAAREEPHWRRPLLAGAAVAGAGIVAYVGVWAGYGFRYSAVTDPGYRLEWEMMSRSRGAVARGIEVARNGKLLPEAYLFGFAYQQGGAQRRLAFLNGEESITGWWYYFPEAFLLKTPPAFMLLLLWGVVAAALRTRCRSFGGWFLAVPVVVYVAVSMASNLNIGHRHLVPIYPLLFVAAGGTAGLFSESRWRSAVGALLLGAYAVSFVAATPRYLSYFNCFAGGARGGWRYLVDSNIDWGQDLPRLKDWVEANGAREICLAYFGTADPKAYGIPYRKVLLVHDFRPLDPSFRPASGDLFAVSVTLLQGVYADADKAFAEEAVRRGWTNTARVKEWLALRDSGSERGDRSPTLADWMVGKGVLTAEQRRQVEAPLLTTWLKWVRETLVPVGRAGDSILIYRIP